MESGRTDDRRHLDVLDLRQHAHRVRVIAEPVQQLTDVLVNHGVVRDVVNEKSYRILIDEVPKEDSNQGSQLRFQMRYSLPLFVGRPQAHADKPITDILKVMAENLHYRVVETPSPFIEIINNSPLHARLSNLTIHNDAIADKKISVSKGLLGYVLPNSTKRWPLDKEQLAAINHKDIKLIFEQEHQELNVVAAE